MRLENKVAIITGGSRGIGKATALKFVSEGAKVVLVDINKEALLVAKDEIEKLSGVVEICEANVTKIEEVKNVIKYADDKFGQIDILVNNAGITKDGTLVKMAEEDWDAVIDVNLKGVYLFGQAAAKYMADNQGGVILNTSSVVGLYGNYGQSNYAATKWGVIGLTKTWAKELGKKKIRVNAVAPGFIKTPMTEKMPQKVLDMMKDKSPLKLLGEADDIANAFLYLASDEAKYITGTVLSVDGGTVM